MASNRKTYGYAAPGHKEFNDRLKARRNPMPKYDVVNDPWMSAKARASLPNTRYEFLKNTDPVKLRELRSRDKTEAERREESSGRNSKMVRQDKPKANLNPPPEISQPADVERFNRNWLAEQRAAAMESNARLERETQREQQEHHQPRNQYRGPER